MDALLGDSLEKKILFELGYFVGELQQPRRLFTEVRIVSLVVTGQRVVLAFHASSSSSLCFIPNFSCHLLV